MPKVTANVEAEQAEPAEQAATPGEPTDPPELMERVWVSFADGWSVGIVVEIDAAEDTLLDPYWLFAEQFGSEPKRRRSTATSQSSA